MPMYLILTKCYNDSKILSVVKKSSVQAIYKICLKAVKQAQALERKPRSGICYLSLPRFCTLPAAATCQLSKKHT